MLVPTSLSTWSNLGQTVLQFSCVKCVAGSSVPDEITFIARDLCASLSIALGGVSEEKMHLGTARLLSLAGASLACTAVPEATVMRDRLC